MESGLSLTLCIYVEYVRMFAKVAQVQFQALLDALNEHVNRLGELSSTAKAPGSG
ncbi:MAG TPA: hypothetical protein VFB83_11080 [Propionibacteriaceae bacterium]|nr:hypothetical protein [Propionibacteriaceae bacterium]